MFIYKLRCVLALTCVAIMSSAVAQSENSSGASYEGLVLSEDSNVDSLYVLPEADFSGYTKVIVLEADIAFKKNWQRDQNRNSRGARVTDKDVVRIIDTSKDLFEHVFTDKLEAGGYTVVSDAAEDVLLVKPSIINLDITSPDVSRNTAGQSRSYNTGAGEATLYVELYDSVTGQILARATDRQIDRDTSMRWGLPATSVSNQQEAIRVFGYWAGLLVDGLDAARGADSE